jgi:organic radical activating enzyme
MSKTQEIPDVPAFEDISLPVAEIFNSVQGEGRWAGTPMTFVRLAGCNVGKPFTADERKKCGLQVYQERCTDWNGKSFACDTNYKRANTYTVQELLDHPLVKAAYRVCLTGGEPLMHPASVVLIQSLVATKVVHVETSGTKPEPPVMDFYRHLWITVSPKQGCLDAMLERADDIKVLVDVSVFDRAAFLMKFGKYIEFEKVCVSPVNGLTLLDTDNAKLCFNLCMDFPKLRLSMQLHKVLNVR